MSKAALLIFAGEKSEWVVLLAAGAKKFGGRLERTTSRSNPVGVSKLNISGKFAAVLSSSSHRSLRFRKVVPVWLSGNLKIESTDG